MKINRSLTAPKQTFFLMGPRGTGKSSWLKEMFPRAHTFDLLDESVYQKFLADPSLFSGELGGGDSSQWVVVDEIQRCPIFLMKFIVPLKTKGDGLSFVVPARASCGGRELIIWRARSSATMHPFTLTEMGDHFDVDTALRYGLLPVVFGSTEKSDTLTSYAQLYLKEEIQGEAAVRNLPVLRAFFPLRRY
jgi:hypothetical protein